MNNNDRISLDRVYEEFKKALEREIRAGRAVTLTPQLSNPLFYRSYRVNKVNKNDNHPELKPGERFWTNVDADKANELLKRSLFTRAGKVAYDIDGKELSCDIIPIFTSFSNTKHPELQEGEEFVTNSAVEEAYNKFSMNEELRIGIKAYDINGELIDRMLPIFRKKALNYEDCY